MLSNASNYQYVAEGTRQAESLADTPILILLPIDYCSMSYDENTRKAHQAFFIGTQRHTSTPQLTNGPPGMTLQAETVHETYPRVFVYTNDSFEPDINDHLYEYERSLLRELSCKARETYKETRPTSSNAIGHWTAYTKAFDDAVGSYRDLLPGIALHSRVITAPDLIETYNLAPSLRDPQYYLYEILPVDLSEHTTELPAMTSAEVGQSVSGEVERNVQPVIGWVDGRLQWLDQPLFSSS